MGKYGVNDVIFQGTSALSMDAKGRMNIPQKHRDVLLELCQGQLTLTKHPDGCLQMLPRQAWERLQAAVADLPMNSAAVKRFFLGSAADVEMDAAGRILISPELRGYANLTREIVLLGVGGHFEVWDSCLYVQAEQKAIDAGMSELLSGLSF